MTARIVTFAGRLTRDPEVKTTSNNKTMLKFSVAETPRVQNAQGQWVDGDTIFHNCTLFGFAAVDGERNLAKGVNVVGFGTADEWTGNDGQVRVSVNVQAIGISVSQGKGATIIIDKPGYGSAPQRSTAPAASSEPDPFAPTENSFF